MTSGVYGCSDRRVMIVKNILPRELESLPKHKLENLLAFVRFLKIDLIDSQYLEERFVASVA